MIVLAGIGSLLILFVVEQMLATYEKKSSDGIQFYETAGAGAIRSKISESASSRPSGPKIPTVAVSGIGTPQPVVNKPFVARSKQLDWNRYKGTLSDQISIALAEMNGKMASDLAAKLQECILTSKLAAAEERQSTGGTSDPSLSAVRLARLQEEQRHQATCQTVAGDLSQYRIHLLEIAVQQNVVGAAAEIFQAGVHKPEIARAVASDASAGDIQSLFLVAAYKAETFNLNYESQQAARYALRDGSADPSFGERIDKYRKNAEAISAQISSGNPGQFYDANIQPSVRLEALAIAQRLRNRLEGALP